MKSWLVLAAAACSSYAPAPQPPAPACTSRITVRVADEAGRPVVGARVRSVATYRQFGPSMLPEASHTASDESPSVATDAQGNASVCDAATARGQHQSHRTGSIVVEHRDWPPAHVPAEQRAVTIGPARSAVVQVPVAATCTDPSQIRVTAYDLPHAREAIRGTPTANHHFKLANLGPWRYWVRSDVCGVMTVRVLDGRDVARVLTMDRSESFVELPELAGATITLSRMRESTPISTSTLSAAGTATLALPASPGQVFCLLVQTADRCVVTLTRVGEVARAGMYHQQNLARDCGTCPL